MEYEIDDDPQGEVEKPEAARDGGIKEDLILRNRQPGAPSLAATARPGPPTIFRQMGE